MVDFLVLSSMNESFKMRNVSYNLVNSEKWSIATNAERKLDAIFPAKTACNLGLKLSGQRSRGKSYLEILL